jgi:all-trans-retinol 13,14-reductase
MGRWERSIAAKAGGRGVEDGISHMYAFVGIRGTKKDLELRESNIWCLPADEKTFDLDDMCEKYYENPRDGLPDGKILLFMGFPSAKDPSWHEKHPNQSTCVIITEAKTEWFEQWFGMKAGKRGDEYNEFKNQWKERLIEGLFKFYPKCRGNIEYVELGSPATNEMYLGRSASYGLGPSPKKFVDESMVDFSPKDAEIPGLFHSGQDTLTAGVFGCLMAGFVTAHSVLGYDWIDLLVADRNLADDMENVPKE